MQIYIGFSCTSSAPPPPCTAVLSASGRGFFRIGRSSSSPESRLQKIGFLMVLVPGSASLLLLCLRWPVGVVVRVVVLSLSPLFARLRRAVTPVPPPMAATYRRTTVRRAFRYLSIIVKTNYGGGVVGGLHGNTRAASHLVVTVW